jgi:hypothetical protein
MPILETVYNLERTGKVSLMPFFYSTSNTTVVASPSTTTTAIPIQSDSHFIARYATLTAYTGAANAQIVAAVTSPLLIQFLDTAAGRTLFDNPQPIGNVIGGLAAANAFGSLPFIFPEPWLIRAAGNVQVAITNIGSVVPTRVDVTLSGFKVYSLTGSGLPNI